MLCAIILHLIGAQDNKHAPAPTTPQHATDRRVRTPQPPAGCTANRGAVARSGTTPSCTPAPPQHPHARACAIEAHVRSLFASRPSQTAGHAPAAVPTTVDAALDVFGARVQADMRDFRALCGALVRAEQQEKEQWRELCRRVIGERDAARAALGGGAPPAAVSGAPVARKRVHDSSDPASDTASRSPSAPAELTVGEQPRAVRPLPGSRSHSRSSSTGSGSNSQRGSSESTARSTPPPLLPLPLPALSDEPCTPVRNRSAPPSSAAFKVRLPSQSAPTAPNPPMAPEADAPPPKRRRSCDLSLSALRPPAQVQAHGASRTATRALVLPSDFDHKFDIMYVADEGGALVCRGCMYACPSPDSTVRRSAYMTYSLEAAKASPADPSTRVEPRTFPKGASWDELREHAVRAHPAACVDVARLHPAEIFELRRRLSM